MAFSTFGIGTPYNPAQLAPFGGAPYGLQGPALNPYATQQPWLYGQQQLQQLQQLVFAQQQQLQQIQQLLHVIPNQLAQLQQLVQLVPQQIQQAYGSQLSGTAGFGMNTPWTITPQAFGQPGHVM